MISVSTTHSFGPLLKQLRKRAGMSQSDLAAALGYSTSFVCALEKGRRLPDPNMVVQHYLPALGLTDAPHLATQLVNAAAQVCGERAPTTWERQSEPLTPSPQEATGAARRLPFLPTRLIGREPEVEQLSKRLLGHHGRLLTLVGPPGIGKTRLALAVAERIQPYYDDGTFFVPLATATTAEDLAITTLAVLGRSEATTLSPKNQLLAFLQHKAMLLVLDNLEQISDAAPFIADLLAGCSRLVVLATSRERLYLRAEQRYKVPPLAVTAATELFVQQAQSLEPEFAVTPENGSTIAAICHKLDCLPLAIELSVARLDLFSVTDLLSQLQDRRLDLLDDPVHDLPPHHRTLRNAIHRSYLLLTESTRPCFCALSVFVGDFDLAAAVAIGCNKDTLQMLHNKSLVQLKPTASSEHRFLLLETIRDYGQEQLQNGGVQITDGLFGVQQRHADYFLHLAEQLDPTAESDAQKYWIQRLKVEYLNIRAALAWTLQQQQVEKALRFVWALRWYWLWFDWRSEGSYWVRPIIQLTEQTWADLLHPPANNLSEASRQQLAAYVRGLYTFSEFCTTDPIENQQLLQQCRLLDQRGGLSALTPVIYHRLARSYRYADAYRQHDELQQQCLRLLPLIPTLTERTCKHEMAWSLQELGVSALSQGDFDRAEQYHIQSQQLFRSIGNNISAAFNVFYQSGVAYQRGEIAQAQALLDSCWDELINTGIPPIMIWPYHLAGLIAVRAGDAVKAAKLLNQGLERLPHAESGIHAKNNPFLILLYPLAEVARQIGQLELAACLLGATGRLVATKQFYVDHSIYRLNITTLADAIAARMPADTYQSAYTLGYNMTLATLTPIIVQWLNELAKPAS